MTDIDIADRTWGQTAAHTVGDWWPLPAAIAVALFAQHLLLTSRFDVGGHAAEHLDGASAPFMASAMLCIFFWATPAARGERAVIATALVWFATTVLVSIGNVRVIDDLVEAGYSHTPTSSVPDVADHSLADASAWYALAAALLFVGVARWGRVIGNRTTIGAIVATLIVPPWIVPGAGMIVVAIARVVVQRRKRGPDSGTTLSRTC